MSTGGGLIQSIHSRILWQPAKSAITMLGLKPIRIYIGFDAGLKRRSTGERIAKSEARKAKREKRIAKSEWLTADC